MIMVPFIVSHLDGFVLQKEQPELVNLINNKTYAQELSNMPFTYSLIKNGIVIGIGGL